MPRKDTAPSPPASALSTPPRAAPVGQRRPSITFTPTTLSLESTKGVQDITRKVIKQLEGLGHLEPSDNDSEDEPAVSGTSTRRSSMSSTNGSGSLAKPSDKPVDYEIPRKLLHSSIGMPPVLRIRGRHFADWGLLSLSQAS